MFATATKRIKNTKLEINKLNLKRFLNQCFDENSVYKSNIYLFVKSKGQMKSVGNYEISRLDDIVNSVFYRECDYYITANTTKYGSQRRLASNLFSIQNIVIDIDCHNDSVTDYERKELLEDFLFYAKKDLVNINSVPVWNIEHYTGRGLQLWWNLKSSVPDVLFMFKITVKRLVEAFNSIINNYSALKGLQADSGASIKELGLFRLPCTYNTKACTYTHYNILSNKKYKLDDMFNSVLALERPERVYNTFNCNDGVNTSKEYLQLNVKRLRALELILKDKQQAEGYRDIIIFLAYNCAIQIYESKEMAVKRVENINNSFIKPLRRLDNIIHYIDSKGFLKFKINTFNKLWLNLTDDEIKKYGLQRSTSETMQHNGTRDTRRKINKEERNTQIMQLAIENKTCNEIAKKVGCSEKTVRTVLKDFDKNLMLKSQIQELKKKGLTQKVVSQSLKMGIATVKRYWN